MKSLILFAWFFICFIAQPFAQSTTTFSSEIAYLEEINNTDVQSDSLVVLLLMQQYLNTNKQKTGIDFFEAVLKKRQGKLSDSDKALYLNVLGILRATYAEHIFLLRRIGWVNKTIDRLEKARVLSNDDNFISHWSAGVVYAQLPWFFSKKKQAYKDLNWIVEHKDRAPVEGFLREVYFQLARLYNSDGEKKKSDKYLKLSKYKSLEKEVIMISSWALERETGLSFKPWGLKEIIPGRVYNLSSVEFTEYNFIISEDRKELISIDMGSRPEAAKQAYEYLKNSVPNLPRLTTVLMTHSHGDHIGGYDYFKKINPDLKVVAMSNHHDEWNRFVHAPNKFYLFGTNFTVNNLMNYKVTQEVEKFQSIDIGGTNIELIPIEGGETPDAMFIHLPKYKVLYVGDFIMPMMGDPLLEEGNIPGLFTAIDKVAALNPSYILHGHEGLDFLYPTTEILTDLKQALEWLYNQTVKEIEKGSGRSAIHHLNLIAPSVYNHPNIQLQYLINRENFINRIFDKKTGYWELETLDGIDILDDTEYGLLLVKYFRQSEGQIYRSTKKMIKNGEYDLAFKTLQWATTQYSKSKRLEKMVKLVSKKLIEKHQFLSPFKMSIYGFKGEQEVLQLDK